MMWSIESAPSRQRGIEILGRAVSAGALLFFLGASSLAGQNGQARAGAASITSAPVVAPYRITEGGRFEFDVGPATGPISVNGVLDEDAWRDAARIALPYESNPGDNTPAQVETDCFVTFDDENLYFGCEAFDPDAEGIRAYVTDRDDIGSHDRIVLTLDPFNDTRRAFEFGISALGVQFDAVFAAGNQNGGGGASSDASWDAIWNSAGMITERGYTVEAAIPFKSLRFPSASDVQTWGFYLTRQWPRSDRVETRSMLWDRNDDCVLCQANLLTGFENITPGRNVEFTPTLTSARTDRRQDFPSGGLTQGDVASDFGLDALWGITTDLTLNATVNPDFSQVEADVAQLDVNSRFALFFPEKRPFFLEGADFFQTPLQAVFTRTIADPSFGTKLTGKSGSNALGAIVARDEVNNIIVPGDLSSRAASLDGRAVTAIGRFRRDIGESSTIGVLYVGREGDDYFNRVGGMDGQIRLASALTAQVQYLHSETDYPDDKAVELDQPTESFGGDAAVVRLRYNTRNWFAQWDARYTGDSFRTDAGFISQVNVRSTNAWFDRRFWGGDDDFYTRLTLSGGAWHNENLDGRLVGEGAWANFSYQGPLQSDVWFNPNLRRQFFAGETHEMAQFWMGGSIRPSGNVGFNFSGVFGDDIDFTNGGKAKGLQFRPGLDLRIGRRLDFRLTHTFQKLSTEAGVDILTANLSQVRGVYNLSPRSFVRAIVQYRDTDRNPDMHDFDVNRSQSAVFTQLLFSYKVNPQTVVFLGYSDSRDAFTDKQFIDVPLTQTSRSFFLKLGYALRP